MSPARKQRPIGPLSLAGVAGVLLLSCMAAPPANVRAFDGGRIRASSQVEAARVEGLVSKLRPEVLDLLPDSHFADLEVWVQERPGLYRFGTEGTADAEGLWSPSHRRIMLSRHADHLERTLAHEMTHAALGPSWRMLPGSLEEGLADHVSASLCADGAARLRAGRLSSACLATGGLALDVDIVPDFSKADPSAPPRGGWSARIRLKGDTQESDPLDVFRLAAGLSSTRLDTGAKRGFYGLAYLVVSRIAERDGYEGLHALCSKAEQRGDDEVPVEEVLAAAGLSSDPADWARAAAEAMGRAEIVELVRMYPDFLVHAVDGYLTASANDHSIREALQDLDVTIRLAEGSAHVSLDDLPFVREALLASEPTSEGQIVASAR